MKENIVKIMNDVPVVSTLDMWEGLGVKHKAIIDLIRKYESVFSRLGTLEFLSVKSGGRPTPFCLLNETQAKLIIILMKNTEKIAHLKFEILLGEDILHKIVHLDNVNKREGSVYLLQKSNNLVKIGCSTNPEKRINAIQTHMGEKFKNIYVTNKTEKYRTIERELHKHYKGSRQLGEWFEIDYQLAKKELRVLQKYMEKH